MALARRMSTLLTADLLLPRQRRVKKTKDQKLCSQCAKAVLHKTKSWKQLHRFRNEGCIEYPQGLIPTGCRLFDVFPGLPRLATSAERGCRVCALLRASILEDHRRWVGAGADGDDGDGEWSAAKTDETIDIELAYRVDAHPGPILSFQAGLSILSILECNISSKSIKEKLGRPIKIEFQIATSSDGPMSRYLGIPARYLSKETLSDANIHMIKSWISDCQSGHPDQGPDSSTECRDGTKMASKESKLPTRLVYVGKSPGLLEPFADDQTRLIIPADEGLASSTAYAALSYCWGTGVAEPSLKTTTATMVARKTAIPWSVLPLTLREACLVCRALGIRYIWIDALCIVQDDPSDWAREAAAMGTVYQSALVTLAPVAASSTHEGFLAAPGRHSNHETYLPVRDPCHAIDDEFRLRYLPPSDRGAGSDGGGGSFVADVAPSAWNSRGWTFQERQLASRIVFFGARGIHFECRSFRRSEDFPAVIRRDFRWQRLLDSDAAEWRPYSRMWMALVEEYSTRRFTNDSDKIPAISSLAGLFHQRLTKVLTTEQFIGYCDGMWSMTIGYDLLWTTQEAIARERIDGIPTWSWFSVRSPIGGVSSWVETELPEPMWFVSRFPGDPRQPAMSPSGFMSLNAPLGELNTYLGIDLMAAGCLRFPNRLELAIPTWGSGGGGELEEEGAAQGIGNPFLGPDFPGPVPRITILFDTDRETLFRSIDDGTGRTGVDRGVRLSSLSLALGFYSRANDVAHGLVLCEASNDFDGLKVFKRVGVFQIRARGKFKLDFQLEVIQKFGFKRTTFTLN